MLLCLLITNRNSHCDVHVVFFSMLRPDDHGYHESVYVLGHACRVKENTNYNVVRVHGLACDGRASSHISTTNGETDAMPGMVVTYSA